MTSERAEIVISAQNPDTHDNGINLKASLELSTIAEATDTDLHTSHTTSDAGSADADADANDKLLENETASNAEDSAEEDVTLELQEFDWNEFENNYNEALQKLDKEESQILDQFDQLMEMFFIWAQTGSSRETERAVKRLKTRERYVQLSEESLEKKKAHYIQVVSAFKVALDMLRN